MENQIIDRKKTILSKLESIFYEGDISRSKERNIIERLKADYANARKAQQESEGSLVSIKDQIDESYEKFLDKLRIKEENLRLQHKNERDFLMGGKKKVIQDLKLLVNDTDHIGKSYEQIKEIQEKWKSSGRLGNEDEAEVDLQNQYNYLIDLFYHNININKELRDIDYKRNLTAKQAIIEKFDGFEAGQDVRDIERKLRKIQGEWRSTGPVPWDDKDAINQLFDDKQAEVNKIVEDYYESKRGELNEKLRQKIELCESVNVLSETEVTSPKEWGALTEQVIKSQATWKEIGFSSENEKIWNVFRGCCDGFFEKKRDFFGKLDQQRIENTNRKMELCAQAEAMAEKKDWAITTQKYLNLQTMWKEIGPATRSEETKLWTRFRTACDKFFNQKREHYTSRNSEHEENLKVKEDLIQQITTMVLTEEPDEDFLALKQISAKWNDTGFVPFEKKDDIIQQYRAAMEDKYKALKLNDTERKSLEYQNRLNKLVDSKNPNKVMNHERKKLSDKIDRTREELTRYENNIGFFGEGAEDNPLFKDINKKIGRLRGELKDLIAKRRQMDETIEEANRQIEAENNPTEEADETAENTEEMAAVAEESTESVTAVAEETTADE